MRHYSGFTPLVTLSFAALYLFGYNGGEHPKEHPTNPKRQAKDNIAEFNTAVEKYARDTIKATKTLPVQNLKGEKVKIAGTIELVRIHKDKVIRYEGDTYFACADFIATDGEKKTNYDFDFFMTKGSDGWRPDRVLLHKIEGKLQMTYKDNKPAPVEEEKPKQEHPQEHPKKQEHPQEHPK